MQDARRNFAQNTNSDMEKPVPRTFVPAIVIALLPVGSFSQDAPGIDPQAIEIATSSSDYLARQQTISVGWLITYDEVVDGREKLTSVWAGDSLLVRGVGYRSRSTEGAEVRDYAFDGKTFTAVFADQQEYAQIGFEGDFGGLAAELDDTYDFPLPLADLLTQANSTEGFDNATDAVYLGEVLFGEQAAHHLAFRSYDGDWEMWISADEANPVPLMMTGTSPYQHGWPKFQALFFDWDFAAEVAPNAFVFNAPDAFELVDLTPIAELEE